MFRKTLFHFGDANPPTDWKNGWPFTWNPLIIGLARVARERADDDFTRENEDQNIFYLIAVKCPVMASQLGVGMGGLILEKG